MNCMILGDLFALTTKHFDRLLRLPYGCGEENLINFVPAIMAARYLAITSRFTPALQQKVENITYTGLFRIKLCLNSFLLVCLIVIPRGAHVIYEIFEDCWYALWENAKI